jgi:hypothetical protein
MILDDSGSMQAYDGQRLMKPAKGAISMVKCSRWSELSAAAEFHAEFSDIAQAPTEFRLLNGGDPIVIGEYQDDGQARRKFMEFVERGPSGGTPLCRHIKEVTAKIRQMAPELRARNQKVSLTIATDGQASDGDVASALRDLVSLPVWTVIRLCTDEENVVNYWNNIDNNIELEMDVLDDLCGECEEVMSKNDWLVYGEPLHRLREFGCHRKELDIIDEALLSPDQLLGFFSLLFGGKSHDYPHPQVDPEGLIDKLKTEIARQPPVWSPRSKRMTSWIDPSKVKSRYIGGKCSIM